MPIRLRRCFEDPCSKTLLLCAFVSHVNTSCMPRERHTHLCPIYLGVVSQVRAFAVNIFCFGAQVRAHWPTEAPSKRRNTWKYDTCWPPRFLLKFHMGCRFGALGVNIFVFETCALQHFAEKAQNIAHVQYEDRVLFSCASTWAADSER